MRGRWYEDGDDRALGHSLKFPCLRMDQVVRRGCSNGICYSSSFAVGELVSVYFWSKTVSCSCSEYFHGQFRSEDAVFAEDVAEFCKALLVNSGNHFLDYYACVFLGNHSSRDCVRTEECCNYFARMVPLQLADNSEDFQLLV